MKEHPQARKVVEILTNAGYTAYYAGGWVRDFLLGRPSDDIDIATDASPEVIQALFPHNVPIGIAFGIVLVILDGHQYEVATFRQDLEHADGRRPLKIAFASAEEDAKRRDFTINGMFYNPLNGEILDFVGGKKDLQDRCIRAIGNPDERIREDYLRMIRGVRLACRLHFTIEKNTAAAIRSHANSLFPAVAIERVMQELAKAHAFGTLRTTLIQLHEFGLLAPLFPELKGLSLAELETRLDPIRDYPADLPLVVYLLSLFPHFSLEEALFLCKKLKRTNLEMQFVDFLFRLRNLLELEETQSCPIERVKWAYVYANPFAPNALRVLGCHISVHLRDSFLKRHEARIEELSFFIERIQEKRAIVQSKDLFALGISEGKQMGLLLKEADRIAINENLKDPSKIIERLKKLPIWPKNV